MHHHVIESFYKWMNHAGINAVIKKEEDLVPEDIKDKDLCLSVGKAKMIKAKLFCRRRQHLPEGSRLD